MLPSIDKFLSSQIRSFMLGKILNVVLSKRGWKIVKKQESKNRKTRKFGSTPGYHRLEKLPSLSTIIDVGVGDEGSPFLYERFEDAFYISIDPVAESEEAVNEHLRSDQSVFIEKALGSNTGEIELEVSNKASRTSLYERTEYDSKSDITEKRTIELDTLDRVISDYEFESPCLLKIDTEGGELEVLKGGKKTLKKVDYVVLEMPLTKNFENSYTFSDAIIAMRENGFEVFQILKAQNRTADVLFCKSDDKIRQEWAKDDHKLNQLKG